MSRGTIRKCIVKMNDPDIGDYFLCKKCKHFMLSTATAKLHLKCKFKLFATFDPEEEIYRCSTCGRYYDVFDQWSRHDELHRYLGNYDSSNFVYRLDPNNFVVN